MRVSRLKVAGLLAFVAAAACSNPFGREYEYEEQLYLDVNGSASVVISASIPAFVALRGLPLDPSPRTRVDRAAVEAAYASAGCTDVRVSQPWIRHGRRFIQVRLSASDVTGLAACGPLAWSSYRFDHRGDVIHYEQVVGASTGTKPADVNWNGSEVVGFKLHLPSRISFHNVKRLEDGSNGEPDRGNILTWEQWLTDRLASRPVHMEVAMDAQSILYHTLWLFGGAFAAAVALLMGLIWLTMRRAKKRPISWTQEPPASLTS